MQTWLIYEPPGGARPTLDDTEKFVLLREGFSKTVFLLAPFWLLWRRCWIAFALWAAAMAFVAVLFHVASLGGGAGLLFLALPNLAIGLECSWIRARGLERAGFVFAGSVLARSRDEAEVLFFSDWLADQAAEPARPAARGVSAPFQPAASGVLGLFPAPGAAR